jgi:hypothetical protein
MPGDGDGKTPMDFDLLLVASFFPGTDCTAQPIGVVQSAVEALTHDLAGYRLRKREE